MPGAIIPIRCGASAFAIRRPARRWCFSPTTSPNRPSLSRHSTAAGGVSNCFSNGFKQHLRIKAFYGNSDNAVRGQVWIAISVYLLVAILKKRLRLPASLYTILQIFSITLF